MDFVTSLSKEHEGFFFLSDRIPVLVHYAKADCYHSTNHGSVLSLTFSAFILLLISMSIPPCIRPVFILFLIEGSHLPAVFWGTPPIFIPQLRQDFYEESGVTLIFQARIGVFPRCLTVSVTPTVNMYYIVYSHFIYYTCTIYAHTHTIIHLFTTERACSILSFHVNSLALT